MFLQREIFQVFGHIAGLFLFTNFIYWLKHTTYGRMQAYKTLTKNDRKH